MCVCFELVLIMLHWVLFLILVLGEFVFRIMIMLWLRLLLVAC